jgi:hypothetical protein
MQNDYSTSWTSGQTSPQKDYNILELFPTPVYVANLPNEL